MRLRGSVKVAEQTIVGSSVRSEPKLPGGIAGQRDGLAAARDSADGQLQATAAVHQPGVIGHAHVREDSRPAVALRHAGGDGRVARRECVQQ
jgi:hypothetical protein